MAPRRAARAEQKPKTATNNALPLPKPVSTAASKPLFIIALTLLRPTPLAPPPTPARRSSRLGAKRKKAAKGSARRIARTKVRWMSGMLGDNQSPQKLWKYRWEKLASISN